MENDITNIALFLVKIKHIKVVTLIPISKNAQNHCGRLRVKIKNIFPKTLNLGTYPNAKKDIHTRTHKRNAWNLDMIGNQVITQQGRKEVCRLE